MTLDLSSEIPHQDPKTWLLYGYTVASEWPFSFPMISSRLFENVDLFLRVSRNNYKNNHSGRSQLYSSPNCSADGKSLLSFFKNDKEELLHYPGVADFSINDHNIECRPYNHTYKDLIEIRLLGGAVPFWLERKGMPVLHASSVVLSQGAVAFLGGNRSGKTVLAASFMQVESALLTDDLLAIESADSQILGRPSYPAMRLWPKEANLFSLEPDKLPPVLPGGEKRILAIKPNNFGNFCSQSQPIICIYLPERQIDTHRAIEITPLDPRQALLALLRYSFLGRLAEAAGLGPQRLEILSQLARRVPVRRLRYPAGFERLPEVRESIFFDVAA